MNVIDIGEFRLKHQRRYISEGCKHIHLTLDDHGEFVTCDDCGKQVGNYAALRMLIDRWALLQERVNGKQRLADEALEKTVVLRAALKVERAWRSRSMVPTCPHCHRAIFPDDGFGGSATNKAIELRRRAVARASTPPTVQPPHEAGKPGAA